MSYADFEATGTSVPFACSICGRRRLFPDQLVYSDDKLFRCTDACDERTAYNVDQQRAAWRAPPEPVPSIGGPLPQGEVVTTFLQDSADFRSQVIPGWTPTNTLSDDFAVLPGAVGSSWSTSLSGTGSVMAAPGGGVRLSGGTGFANIYAASFSIPLPTAGRFYCRARFAAATPNGIAGVGVTSTAAGVPSGNRNTVGAVTTLTDVNVRMGSSTYRTDPRVYVESSTTFHTTEMWWKGDGYLRFVVDGIGRLAKAPLVSELLTLPVPFCTTGLSALSIIDVTNYIAFT